MRRTALLITFALLAGLPARAEIQTIGKPPAAAGKAAGAKPAVPEKPFRLGILTPKARETAVARVEPFRRQLALALGRDVTVHPFADESALVGALTAGRLDYAPLTALGYASTVRLCNCVEPLAAPRDADGTPGWYAIVVAKDGSGIAKAEDLAHRRLAVSRDPAIGTRRIPLKMLEKAGLTGAKAPVLIETDGPAAALGELLAERADAAVVWSSLSGDPAEGWTRGTVRDAVAKGLVASKLKLVWSSPVLSLGPHVVATSMPELQKRRLREMLIELDTDPEAYAAIEPAHPGGFMRVGAPSYRPFVDLLTPEEPRADDPAGSTGAVPPKG